MKGPRSAESQRVLKELERQGLLLLSDLKLPSVTTIVAGAAVHGSWWGHPRGHAIAAAAGFLAEHSDVALAKLVSGKVTFIHRRLWPALFAVASAREPWQLRALPGAAESLLSAVERQGELRTDRLPQGSGGRVRDAAKELERRLLIYSEEMHTETGAHARRLETWEKWARRVDLERKKISSEEGRKELEEAVAALNRKSQASGLLPWQAF